MDIVLLIGGLLLILVGVNALTDGAASVAKRFNISSLVIGLTIGGVWDFRTGINGQCRIRLERKLGYRYW